MIICSFPPPLPPFSLFLCRMWCVCFVLLLLSVCFFHFFLLKFRPSKNCYRFRCVTCPVYSLTLAPFHCYYHCVVHALLASYAHVGAERTIHYRRRVGDYSYPRRHEHRTLRVRGVQGVSGTARHRRPERVRGMRKVGDPLLG